MNKPKLIKVNLEDHQELKELRFDFRVETLGEVIHRLIEEYKQNGQHFLHSLIALKGHIFGGALRRHTQISFLPGVLG